jgi:hypothetical protein
VLLSTRCIGCIVRCKIIGFGAGNTELVGFEFEVSDADVVADDMSRNGTSAILDTPSLLGIVKR